MKRFKKKIFGTRQLYCSFKKTVFMAKNGWKEKGTVH